MTTTSVTSTTSGVTVISGNPFDVVSGGSLVSATILSGGSVTVQVGGSDTGSIISAGGSEEVLGSASGDMVAGVQVVTSGSAIVRDETILNGGTIELLKSGATGSALTVETGGTLDISGAATASNTVVSGGLVDLETAAASIAGTLTFAGSATLEITSVASTGSGALATIGGFTAGDVIDVAFISSGATLTTTTSGGNTLATITSGGVTETLTFSGTTIGSSLALVNAGAAGEEITFAAAPPTSSSTTTSVTTSTASGAFVVSSGMALDVFSGGTIVAATILSGGSATIQAGGVDSGSTISAGGNETVLGTAIGDLVGGTQLISAATAAVNDETVVNGGNVELFLAGATATGLTVDNGGTLAISGHAIASNTVLNGGALVLESAKSTISGSLTFSGAGTLQETAPVSGLSGGVLLGDAAVISGFGAGDVIDLTSSNTVGAAGASATLSTTTSGGNTIATVSGGGSSESFVFAGTAIATGLQLGSDNNGGEAITSATSPATLAPALSAFTAGDLVISLSGDGEDDGDFADNAATPIVLQELSTSGGPIIGQLDLPQFTTVVNGVTEYAISGEYGSSSEGTLQLSANGESIVIAGYGVNATAFNEGGTPMFGTSALAQSTSLQGGPFTAVPRVIADIGFNGSIDTSTALFNVFNTNNPRSVATVNGTSFFISGQGVKGDTTQGLFVAQDGASSATPIDTSEDTRTAEIINGQLFLSEDSTQGAGGEIVNFGTSLPTGPATPTVLPGIDGSIALTAAQENGINNANAGQSVNLSPEDYFFASSTVLYVADGGDPKEGGLGDGGLQKWIFNGTSWNLAYTLTAGLNLVPDTDTHGTSGLIGLTGTVVGGNVELFATNETLNDLDQTFLFGISDTLSATTLPTNESFTVLETAAPDTLIRGVTFAPTASATVVSNTTISAGSSQSGVQVTNGSFLDVLSGGTAISATVVSGGSATVELGGIDSGSFIAQGAEETVLGSATGDTVDGTQLVSAATAVVSNESILNGGVVELFLAGASGIDLSVNSGGALVISGAATASDTVLSGGLVALDSADATLSGTLTFAGSAALDITAVADAADGDQAVISGFGVGDAIDLSSATAIGSAGAAATLTSTTSGGNTIATVSGGGSSESFIFAGTTIGGNLVLGSDGLGGEQITFSASAAPGVNVASGVTSSGLVVSNGGTVNVLAGGNLLSATIQNGGTVLVETGGIDSGSTIATSGFENVSGSATGDLVAGTQLVSNGTAIVSNETVTSGGSVDLFLKGAVADNLTVDSGGFININGNAATSNTVLNGGTLDLQSPKANFTGSLTFSGSGGVIEETDTTSAGFGDLGVISGFSAGDFVDDTVIGAGATISTTTSGGNTIATIVNGGVAQPFTFAGTTIGANLELISDGLGGAEIAFTSSPTTSSPTSSSFTASVTSGSTMSNFVVSGGTALDVVSGGAIVSASISFGGSVAVQSGATDSGSTISSGGSETVSGSATGDFVAGTQLVDGTIVGETILSGGSVTVESGGSDIPDAGTTISSGGSETVSGSATGDVVAGTQFVDGTVTSETVLSGGSVTVEVGGVDSGTTISAGGNETVLGTASGDVVGGIQLISAAAAVVNNDIIVNGGAVELFLAGAVTSGLTVDSGGSFFISGHAIGSNTVLSGGVLELQSAKATISGSLTFAGSATLEETTTIDPISGGISFGDQAVISGFGAGDVIDLTAASSAGAAGSSAMLSTSTSDGNTIETVSGGGSSESFIFAGTTIGSALTLHSDGSGGVELTASTVPCFLPGTHILTDRGEVLVEKLQVGDTIVTLSGRTRRLCWIGQGRALATRGRRSAATPVIVRKGALADNVPHRDLHVTKGHALYLDGVLIPVEFLVNHRSILWDDRAQEVTVFHLELEAHDVLVANGAAAESYRDDGNRWLFQNANAGWDQAPKEACAPVLTGGAVVDAIWRRLLDRVGPRPGLPLTDDPDLHLLVDGERVDAWEQHGPVRVFRLVRPARSVLIASREAVPAELGLGRDARSLGVALRRVAVRQGSKFVLLNADDARLADGFHAHEATDDLRWTNGYATLPVEAFAQFTGGVEVVLHVAGTARYPAYGGGAGAVAA